MSFFKSFILRRFFHSCRSITQLLFYAGLSGIVFFSDIEASAQGDLLITPRRVVFNGSKRFMDLNVANTGRDTATYAISLVQIRMKEEGGFETITEPDSGQRFADSHIRFFPRLVTLGPNEAQVVKVQVVKTSELTEGEYRSHFYFRSVPGQKPMGDEDKTQDKNSISVKLTPIFGITIPVIIRIGESSTTVKISEMELLSVNDSLPRLSFVFNRNGNMSVYGDLAVDYISLQGKTVRVGIANGVAVYTPNTIRRFKLNLNKEPGVDFSKGKLHIIYSAPSDNKPAKYAEAELSLH